MILVGATIYAFEIPNYFSWIDKKTTQLTGLKKTLSKTSLAIAYFNPLWIFRHLAFIKLFSGNFNDINLNIFYLSCDVKKIDDIKKIVDDAKNGNEKVAILLIQAKDDKVMLVAGSKNTNIKAGNWIKEIAPIVGGGGGGRPDFAQAGGKDVSKIDEAKAKAVAYAKENL